MVWMVLPLLLSLVDPRAHHLDPQRPGDQPTRATQDANGVWRPASTTRAWRITHQPTGRHLRAVPPH